MKVETIPVGPFEANCHVAWGGEGAALVIDPGEEAKKVLSVLARNKLTVAAYLLTHGHPDHISGLAEMHTKCPAPVGIHELDLEWAFSEVNQLPPFHAVPRRPRATELLLKDGEERTDGGLRYSVIHTPGHSPGGLCFYFREEGVLFSGDTLFAGSIGRTDFPGGSAEVLEESLKRLAALPDDTVIHSGHGPATTLRTEKKTNYFLLRLRGARE